MPKVIFPFLLSLVITSCRFNGNYTSKDNKYNIYINNKDNRYFYWDKYLKSNQLYSQGYYKNIGFRKYLLVPDAATLRIIGKATDTTLVSSFIFRMDSTCMCEPDDYYFNLVDSQKAFSLIDGIQVQKAPDSSLPRLLLEKNDVTYTLDTTGMGTGYNVYYIKPSFMTNFSYDMLKDTGYIVQRFGKLYYTSNSKWYRDGRTTGAIKKTHQSLVWPKLFYCYFKSK